VTYLMAHHAIAELVFSDDPRAMLYAPRRTASGEDTTDDRLVLV
jgi:hypothetical protein